MIARVWRGTTLAERADAYLEYLKQTGFAKARSTPGNLAVSMADETGRVVVGILPCQGRQS